jgi:large-conductance mechanosensitive channel
MWFLIKMLDTRDIIILTASFYLGGVVGEFFKSLSEDILTPLLAPAAAAGKGVGAFSVTMGGVTLKLGEVLVAFVNLVVSFVLVIFAIGLLRTYVLSRIGASRKE